MAKIHEITLAGFDGGTDETDHLVVWVKGDRKELKGIVKGTGATLCGEVDGADEQTVDFTLPGDAEALASRIAEQDAALAPSGPGR